MFKGLSILITTGVAGAMGKIAVYKSDTNGRPAALLLETAAIDMSTATTRAVTVSQTLLKGQTYWLGLRTNAAPTIAAWAAGATPDINGGTPSTVLRKTLAKTVTYANAAPANWSWSSNDIGAGAAPAIWLMV